MVKTIPITDGDLQRLAGERTQAVREYVLKSGLVEARRIFLAEGPASHAKTQGARAYLQLR